MMDTSTLSPVVDGLEVVHRNSVHQDPSNSGEDSVVLNDLDINVIESTEIVASNANFETRNSSVAVIEVSDSNNVNLSKEEEVKITNQTGQLKASKGPIKNKSAKTTTSSVVHASLVKRNKNAKDKETSSAVSIGTSALDSHTRQPIKNKSFNGRQTQLVKHPSNSDAASSEVATEKTEPKSLKKGAVDKVQGESELSPTNAEDAKPRKVGTLPNYGFSFRCGERAERRREFYSKVEEKIHAKEMEKSNLQAKSKESQEAEMKMLRKSLTFKATPLPTFYQEPPPKVELKKIPTTRPKSPKLGRKKSSINSESDGNTSSSSKQGRLTFNEKMSQGNNPPTKGVTLVHPTKPLRRSLPAQLATRRLNSSNSKTVPASSEARKVEKTVSSATKKNVKSSNATKEQKIAIPATNEEDSTLPSETTEALPLNVVDSDKPSEAQSLLNGDLVVEKNPQLAFAQEPITAKH
ncbi:PREDICTED: protein WVD2-like 5 isoform X2 [Lupinus angustifolius]|uniref:protein WVD2-like 5 isoform X2 n=1 Tax=Lupinus angustifolius TaxID=3871 RepID=UPI00092FC544|nr:PREDICTED: protein WVD2-like 5 isoform X2 [Lupinus angustifolius]XP_019438778.1 PREDICTED: protein WVD2-like 5 isoform X2 [Lupinus angustifolius]